MTTPESQKRRQNRILLLQAVEGVFIAVIGLTMLIQNERANDRDEAQDAQDAELIADVKTAQDAADEVQACLSGVISEVTTVSRYRAGLVEREDAAAARVWLVYAEYAGIVKDDPTQELTPEQTERLQIKFVRALLNYKDEHEEVERLREENPVPPYRPGTCGEDPEE